MKFVIGVLLSILMMGNGYCGENDDGFRKLPWNMSIDSAKRIYPDLIFYRPGVNSNSKWYIRSNEDLLLGAGKVDKITYIFDNDRFSSLIIDSENESSNDSKVIVNSENIYKHITSKYGQEDSSVLERSWANDNIYINMKLTKNDNIMGKKYDKFMIILMKGTNTKIENPRASKVEIGF